MECILRPWKESDAPDLAAAANDYDIAKNLRNAFPHPYGLEDAMGFIRDCLSKGDTRQLTRAIVAEGKIAGSIGVFLGSDVYEKSAELGYWLAKPFRRQGIMTQAVRRLCGEAFRIFDLERIYAEPFADNLGSRGVLEKAGFTLEGTMRNGVFKNGVYKSYCMYALLREEWDRSETGAAKSTLYEAPRTC